MFTERFFPINGSNTTNRLANQRQTSGVELLSFPARTFGVQCVFQVADGAKKIIAGDARPLVVVDIETNSASNKGTDYSAYGRWQYLSPDTRRLTHAIMGFNSFLLRGDRGRKRWRIPWIRIDESVFRIDSFLRPTTVIRLNRDLPPGCPSTGTTKARQFSGVKFLFEPCRGQPRDFVSRSRTTSPGREAKSS